MTGFQLPSVGLVYIFNDIFLATQEGCIWLSAPPPKGCAFARDFWEAIDPMEILRNNKISGVLMNNWVKIT